MADSQIQSVEATPFTATEYVAAANALMSVVMDFTKQGDLESASKTLESVNLLLLKSKDAIEQLRIA